MENYAGVGWTCPVCGRIVYYNEEHTCYPVIKNYNNPQLIKRTTTERYDGEGLLIEKIVVT